MSKAARSSLAIKKGEVLTVVKNRPVSTDRKRGKRSANARNVKGSTIVTGDYNTIEYSVPISTEPTALHQLRAPVGDFVGR
jgi:hypothetical protein